MKSLTPKQLAFARQYSKSLNGNQSALAAGYSARTSRVQASQLLAHPMVQEEINRIVGENREQDDVQTSEIVSGLRSIAFAEPAAKISNSDRIRALELLGRYKAMFSDRIHSTFEPEPPIFENLEQAELDNIFEEARRLKQILGRRRPNDEQTLQNIKIAKEI